MKRFWILLLIFILIISAILFLEVRIKNMPKRLSDGRVVYDFSKQYQKRASKILYDYILDDLKENQQVIDDLNGSKISAFEFDLNDDGVNEIIGFTDCPLYAGFGKHNESALFILENINGKYYNIEYLLNFYPDKKIYILEDKTNNYQNLMLTGSVNFDFIERVIKYDGKKYTSGEYENLENKEEKGLLKKSSDGTLVYDFMNQYQSKASKILYEYLLKDSGFSAKAAKGIFSISPDCVSAFEVDLNDDKNNEIIGFCSSTYYWGTAGYEFFMLEKHNDGYLEVPSVSLYNFEPQLKFYILSDKTNGYKNIKFYGSSYYNFKPLVIMYSENGYKYKYYLKK